jgi:hypothetical protein
MSDPLEHAKSLIANIISLTKGLSTSIPPATKDDKISEVMSGSEGESAWQTFNKRFDALFAEDCRDQHGRLHHIRRGKLGMDKVCQYLAQLDLMAMPQDLVSLKLNRLNNEIVYLMYVSVTYKELITQTYLPAAPRPKRRPTQQPPIWL